MQPCTVAYTPLHTWNCNEYRLGSAVYNWRILVVTKHALHMPSCKRSKASWCQSEMEQQIQPELLILNAATNKADARWQRWKRCTKWRVVSIKKYRENSSCHVTTQAWNRMLKSLFQLQEGKRRRSWGNCSSGKKFEAIYCSWSRAYCAPLTFIERKGKVRGVAFDIFCSVTYHWRVSFQYSRYSTH